MDLHYLDLYWVHTRKGQNIGLVGLGSGMGERFGGGGNEPKVGGFKALAKLFIYIYKRSRLEPAGVWCPHV
jgi:hypothetical protein